MEHKKILIIKKYQKGDLVLATPVFRELKNKFPESKITLIISKVSRTLIEKNKNIDEIIELEMPKKSLKTLLTYLKMSFLIRKERFDVGIDLRNSLINSIFLLWLPGIKKRISATYAHQLTRLFVNKPIEIDSYKTTEHVTKENLKIINIGLDMKAKNHLPEIITDKEDEKEVSDFLKKNKINKYICVCPTASMKYKQWDISNFEDIVRWLNSRYKNKFDILIMGSKSDEILLKRFLHEKKCRIVINFDLRRMSLLFKKADLVLTNDGGPMHIAWASNSKLIALFSRYVEWKIASKLGKDYLQKVFPLGKNSKVVQSKGSIDDIDINIVKHEISKILDRK